MDGVSIRVPYRHLREEVELVGLNGDRASTSLPVSSLSPSETATDARPGQSPQISMKMLILSSMIGAGVQFGWALQLSLLTPYVQTLGIGHFFSSFIWLCGPITGFIVQPCVGIWSDRCHSKYGRRRPFIFAGCLMITVAVSLIGFSSDIGYLLGDTKEDCSSYHGPRFRAAIVFILGFWMLDLANNTVQGPARALLADLSGPANSNSANAIFCSWMAVGNILGFSAGSNGNWHRWFPFLRTKACCEACGNLKGAFLVAVVFLFFCALVTLHFAKEIPLESRRTAQRLADSAPLLRDTQQNGHVYSNAELGNGHNDRNSEVPMGVSTTNSDGNNDQIEDFNRGIGAVLVQILTGVRHLAPEMRSVLLVMALTWLSWFPFFLFDTDWMGREVFHGDPSGKASHAKQEAYQNGVREGAFGLLLNSVVLGVSSILIDPMCRRMGARIVWAMGNFVIFICMAATTVLSLWSMREYSYGSGEVTGANKTVRVAALVIFSILGFPLSITYSVPFAVTAELTSGTGGGQGLSTGVLNLGIVVPQMIISLGTGPWDALFGGGNIPSFALASIFSLIAGIVAMAKLPQLTSFTSAGFHGFGVYSFPLHFFSVKLSLEIPYTKFPHHGSRYVVSCIQHFVREKSAIPIFSPWRVEENRKTNCLVH